MERPEYKPPRIMLAFFRWYCHPDIREEIEGDLLERFHNYSKQNNKRLAKWFFLKEVVYLFRPSIIGNLHHLTFKLFSDMKKNSTVFLQVVLVLIGIVALAIMIRFPLTEGRAANLDLFSIYADPFLIYGYLSSIAFFVALYQAFKLLGYIRRNKVFSLNSVRTTKSIKYCAIALGILIVMAGLYIRTFHDKDDDPAGFMAICIVTTFISSVVATTAAVVEKILQNGVDIKLENEQLIEQSKK